MAISTEITWSIDSVKRDVSDGFITLAFWTMSGVAKSDGVGIATATQSGPPVGFGTVRPDPMIAYNSVTEANVVGWSTGALGISTVREFESIIPKHLGGLLEPDIGEPGVGSNQASGTPW